MKKISKLLVVSLLLIFSASVVMAGEADYKMAVDKYNKKKYDEAVSILNEYVKTRPEASAFYLIGYSLYRLGRHDEASKYFEYAYLIDPTFSPTPELVKEGRWPLEVPKLKMGVTMETEVPAEAEAPAPVAPEAAPAPAAPEAAPAPAAPEAAPAPAAPEAMEAPVAPEAMEAPAAPEAAPAPAPAPARPVVKPAAPSGVFGVPTDISSDPMVALFILGIFVVIYLFFSLCLFNIAKKTKVSAAWTAWIPIVQVWTFVASSGKPGWWIVLLLVPLLNIVVVTYIWMLITEKLGRNKLLGLLTLLPVLNIIFPAYLAFTNPPGRSTMTGGTPAGLPGEDLDF